MNPVQVDYLVDLAYGAMIFISIILIIVIGLDIGIAFGFGVLVSYAIHVVWKMARYDPEWMTREVTENVEVTLSREIDSIIERLEELNERIDRRPRADEIGETVGAVPTDEDHSSRGNRD